MIASAGLAGAAILLAALAAAAWWTHQSQSEVLTESRQDRVISAAQVLARSTEGLLVRDEGLAPLRSLVIGAAMHHHLSGCRIALPKGQVVADIADKVRYEPLPAQWGESLPAAAVAQSPEPSVVRTPEGGLQVSIPLSIPGRGPATLTVIDTEPLPLFKTWRVQAGLGAIGAIGLTGMLVVYRITRGRLRGMGAIREALAALDAGASNEAELTVSAEWGPEAAAWNRLLAERQHSKSLALAEKAAESLTTRKGRDSELYSMCDAMWQGLLLVDDKLKVKYANGAAAVFLKAKREEIVGADATTCLDDPKAFDAVRAVATGSSRSRAMIEVGRPNDKGGGVLRFSVRPVRKDDAAAALVVIEDVTQQRIADEARNGFVAQVTHELRTPLTNIRLYVDSLLEGDSEGGSDQDPVKRAQAVNVISQEAKRLERIVGDMLSVAEIEAGTLKLRQGDVRLDALFKEVEQDFAEQARQKGTALRFDLPPKLPVIRGDRDKIVLALHNLVGNAIKYTPDGGEVVVRINDDAAKSGNGNNGQVAVEIIDNGIGIKPEEAELIFDKFYRAKDKRLANITGSGLGLALAREVVRLHGGDVTVRSQIDKGSTFTMTLPASTPAQRAAA